MDELSGVIQKTLTKISELKTPLERVSLESEPQFVNLGKNLQDIFSGAEGLTTLTRETAMLIDGSSGDNMLGHIGDFSRESLAKLNICREDVINVLPKVETCSTNLKRLYDMCPVIKTIAKKLNIVALHISMESSRSRECEEMFNFFVKEIKQLAIMVSEIATKIREDSEKAKAEKIADFTCIADTKNMLSSLADNAYSSVEENTHHMEYLIEMALKTMRRSGIYSKKISSLVGDIVIAIQFHDIVRQQIEHIVQTLEEISAFFHEDSNGTQTDSLTKAYKVLSLQTEQISQVILEINDAYKKTKKSFHEIGDEVDAMVREMIDLRENTEGIHCTGDPFEQLISGLDQLETIITQGREMAKEIEHNLSESAETAKGLASHLTRMEGISMDLHIKAINALIMSRRLGSEGRTLSVLAEDVTEVSLDSNEFVLNVVEILKAIEGLTVNLSCLPAGEENNMGDDAPDELNLSSGIDLITAVYQDFLDKSSQSVERSKDLKNKIINLESELEFLKDIGLTLSSQQDTIDKIIKSITPFIQEEKMMDGELEHLKERYTMEIERGVHNKAVKNESASENSFGNYDSDEIADGENADDSYLGDNIELF